MTESRPRTWIARLLFRARVAPAVTNIADDADAVQLNQGDRTLAPAAETVGVGEVGDVARFRQAAEAGQAPAQNNLGLMLASGHGVLRSEVEASQWFRRAAEQGDAAGQFNLGNLCHPASLCQLVTEKGEARIQAFMWFSLAAAQGHQNAEASCETINMQMSNAELAEGARRAAAFLPRSEKAR